MMGLFCKLLCMATFLLFMISARNIEYFDNQQEAENIKPSNEDEKNTLKVVTCNMQTTFIKMATKLVNFHITKLTHLSSIIMSKF